jgi:hypothetical protein
MVSEMKDLMLSIGVDEGIVRDSNPANTLAEKRLIRPTPPFLDAIE